VRAVRTRVTFFERDPAPYMTREEVIAWLLGSIGPTTFTWGMSAAWAISYVVDRMKAGYEMPVDTSAGNYLLTMTASGHWWHRVRTYHVRERR
jgi:hypothetical protein